jgi:DNA-binding CsgD family transcriptional regulator
MPNNQTTQLTVREKQVVKMICEDMKYKEIATRLGLGYETVKTYANRIRKKLGLSSKVAVVLWAQSKGLI